jgi:hypothetical protein
VCDVPAERREQVERLRKVGRLEVVEAPRAKVAAAEPSGNDAPAPFDATPAAPAALALDEEPSVEELEAELASLETPPGAQSTDQPKRIYAACKHCGKTYIDHAKGKAPAGVDKDNAADCLGLKVLFQKADAA